MTDSREDLDRWRRRRRASTDERGAAHVRHLTSVPAAPLTRDEWAGELTASLQHQLALAERQGVISAGECEQLSARLVLVIDQALSAG
jgi:hypothetical protein